MSHSAQGIRSSVAVIVALGLASTVGLLPPGEAQAASYRYWSYWTGAGGSWDFSAVGAGSRIPKDGDVEGWRFAASGVDGDDPPRTPSAFADICTGPASDSDSKRIALVVDPGESGDAPSGESPPGAWATCVEVSAEATGYDVLRAAAQVRTDRGLIGAINDYPARECAVAVETDATVSPAAETRSPEAPTDGTATELTTNPATEPAPGPATPGQENAATATGGASPSEAAPAATSPMPTPTATGSSTGTAATASSPASTATPSISVSLITAPATGDGSKGGGGSTAGVLVALVLAGIGVLGAAALLRSRRGES